LVPIASSISSLGTIFTAMVYSSSLLLQQKLSSVVKLELFTAFRTIYRGTGPSTGESDYLHGGNTAKCPPKKGI
jgi:hypothetical protein